MLSLLLSNERTQRRADGQSERNRQHGHGVIQAEHRSRAANSAAIGKQDKSRGPHNNSVNMLSVVKRSSQLEETHG
ncbi:MAG: hypothetical protein MK103_04750 [Planctomycetes bacterium]|nr:hypothetical protein [Planctomycetota bacterium]